MWATARLKTVSDHLRKVREAVSTKTREQSENPGENLSCTEDEVEGDEEAGVPNELTTDFLSGANNELNNHSPRQSYTHTEAHEKNTIDGYHRNV